MNFYDLEGYEVTVNVAATEATGVGPLDHHLSSGPVSRLLGAQKPVISDNFNKNLKVLPVMGRKPVIPDPISY